MNDIPTVNTPDPLNSPHISVVIATRNRGAAIATCIASIQANTLTAWELIIVDQSTDEDTAAAVRQAAGGDSRIRYIHTPAASGTSRARNAAISQAKAPLIAITDDDCEVAPDWLARISAAFDADASIAFIGGTLAPAPYPPGTGDIPNFCPTERAVVERPWPITTCFGGCLAARGGVLERVGLFDEAMGPGAAFTGMEDQDLCHRFLLAGHRVLIAPELRVLHHGFRPTAQLPALWRRDSRAVGALAGKELRCGDLHGLMMLLRFWGYWIGITLWRLLRLQRPLKLRQARAYVLSSAGGFVSALRMPVDRQRHVFAPQSWLSSPRAASPAAQLAHARRGDA